MKYIVEFEDEPCMYEDEVHFYKCIQAPWWGLSERVIKQLTPYQPDAPAIQLEPKWIPCSERLPKEKQSVLVTDGSVIWVCNIISTDGGYKWEDSRGYWLDLDEWTAWRPLPEPYRGGDE